MCSVLHFMADLTMNDYAETICASQTQVFVVFTSSKSDKVTVIYAVFKIVKGL